MNAHAVAGGDFGEVPCGNPAHLVVCPGQGLLLFTGRSGGTFIAVESSGDVSRFGIGDIRCIPLGLFSQYGLVLRQPGDIHPFLCHIPLQIVQKR